MLSKILGKGAFDSLDFWRFYVNWEREGKNGTGRKSLRTGYFMKLDRPGRVGRTRATNSA